MSRRNHQRGAAVQMFTLGLLVTMLISAVIVGVSAEAGRRTHAQTAADAVALAGAAGGAESARRMAATYEAELVEFTIDGKGVRVVLLVDGITSVAQAERHLVATGAG